MDIAEKGIPDIVASYLHESRKILAEAGYKIGNIVVTASPRERKTDIFVGDMEYYRVIRYKLCAGNTVDLLVSASTDIRSV